GDEVADLPVAWPDVAQVHRLAVAAGAERLAGQVDVDRAGDGVGHHQRRRGEVVHLYFGVDAAFEVAVARQHRGDREVVFGDAAASECWAHGAGFSPFAAALRATRPAPVITAGLEVLVQEVIAAITTAPSWIWCSQSSRLMVEAGLAASRPDCGWSPPSFSK